MEVIPQTIAAFAFFGIIFIFPLVALLMRHQRAMAKMMHSGAENDVNQRVAILEREVLELKAARHEEILRQDDQRDLNRRLAEVPATPPRAPLSESQGS